MENENQQEIKTLKDRQAEIYEVEEKINKELIDLENLQKELNRLKEKLKINRETFFLKHNIQR